MAGTSLTVLIREHLSTHGENLAEQFIRQGMAETVLGKSETGAEIVLASK